MPASALPDPARARARAVLGVAVVVVLIAAGAVALLAAVAPPGQTTTLGAGTVEAGGSAAPRPAPLYVHVLGAVTRPGLYELAAGARAIDAVAAAGGFTGEADQGAVNLARFVADGEQLLVPQRGASPPPGAATGGGAPGGRVNVNRAAQPELETLPRVGPALAARIIAHREANGPFTVPADLLDVPGIGTATVEGLAELITF